MNYAITDRMETVRRDLEAQFTNLYCKRDFAHRLKAAACAASDRQPQILKKLADMYQAVGIPCAYGQPLSYYESLYARLPIADTVETVNQGILQTLCSLCTQYPTPEVYMERMLDRLDPETVGTGSLRLRLLRRFLQTVNVRENKKYHAPSLKRRIAEEGMAAVDERMFDALSERPAEKCDYWALLTGCHNLAHGRSVSPAATKELLFLFAFAYDMRYYPTPGAEGYDAARDVEKNLFVDYYCDNLTRFLDTEPDAASGVSDTEPAGVVIHPKSFIDVTFVYYLNRTDLDPAHKTAGFFATLDKVKARWKERMGYVPELRQSFENVPTGTYRGRLNSAFFALDEAQLIEFLLENHYCDVRYSYVNKKTGEIGEGSKGVFEVSFTMNTAYEQYKDILALIREELAISRDAVFSHLFGRLDHRALLNDAELERRSDFATNSDVKYRIELKQWYETDAADAMSALALFENTAFIGEDGFLATVDTRAGAEGAHFRTVLAQVERRLDPEHALCVEDAAGMTRTKMIAAYYHYFCLSIGNDAAQTDRWSSFQDVYDEMGGCLSDYLEDAGYQRINPKNLFDMYVIFLAYCKINDFLN